MDKHVHVYSDNPALARWDGKEYRLGSEPVEVKRGIAEHWKGVHKGIHIKELPAEVIEQRVPENPLEQNNRGTAFAELKKGKKNKKKSDETKDESGDQ